MPEPDEKLFRKLSNDELCQLIININHKSDNEFKVITEGFSRNDAQHNDMIGELKRTNDNWFKQLDKQAEVDNKRKEADSKMIQSFLNFLKWFITISAIALFGAKIYGVI
jgi:hypothetical protein